jgi:mutator family transposase
MVRFAAQRLMELEVESLTGAAHRERSPDRINHRNGYRDRVWETRSGEKGLPPRSAPFAVVLHFVRRPRRSASSLTWRTPPI